MTTAVALVRQARRARDSVRYRRLPRWLRDASYLWYNARKKVDIRDDTAFRAAAEDVMSDGRTMLREDRLHIMWQLVHQLRPAGGLVVEVGVYKGGSSRFLARAVEAAGATSRIFSFDTFEGHAVTDPVLDTEHVVGAGFLDTSADDVRAYLAPFPNLSVVAGDIRETIGVLDGLGPIAFAHIDVDVYPPTALCLDLFSRRMEPGGVMLVDDYGFTTCPGVHRAVEEFLAGRDDFLRLHLLTGQAVLAKVR